MLGHDRCCRLRREQDVCWDFRLDFVQTFNNITVRQQRELKSAYRLQTKQIPFSEVWTLVSGCQVTKIPRASSTTSVILVSLLYLPSEEALRIWSMLHYFTFNVKGFHLIQPQMSRHDLTHPDKKHLLPDTVTPLRLSIHAELIRTPAGGVICDVPHLSWQKMRQSCSQPDTDWECKCSGQPTLAYGIVQQLPCTLLAGGNLGCSWRRCGRGRGRWREGLSWGYRWWRRLRCSLLLFNLFF